MNNYDNHSIQTDSEKNKFDDKGNRTTDITDGITITALMMLVIAGVIYFLYTVWFDHFILPYAGENNNIHK